MPVNKDLKRRVRARMKKTGEAYTTARAHIIAKPRKAPAPKPASSVARAAEPPSIKPAEYASVAGMSDAKLKEKTGCTWERWVFALDHYGAQQMSHRDIAALVNKKYKIDGWWSQMVTVGYERIKGLRARGQRRNGLFEASKSRTFNVPVTKLFDAWADASVRRRWLDAAEVKVRTATAPKSIRLGWTDGSIVTAWFMPKGDSKSVVALAHAKLPDQAAADKSKKYWTERLDALGEVLSGRPAPKSKG